MLNLDRHGSGPGPSTDTVIYETSISYASTMSSGVALKSFSLTNKILEVSPQDEIYRFDAEANKKLNREAPWTKE